MIGKLKQPFNMVIYKTSKQSIVTISKAPSVESAKLVNFKLVKIKRI